jgi:hypothetical protein
LVRHRRLPQLPEPQYRSIGGLQRVPALQPVRFFGVNSFALIRPRRWRHHAPMTAPLIIRETGQ